MNGPASTRTRRWSFGVSVLLMMALLHTLALPLTAHELEESAATLVVREGGAVELRLVCTWSTLLRSTLPNARSAEEARAQLVQLTSESAAQFAARYDRVRRVLEARITASTPDRSRRPFLRWEWPSARDVQNALREELMNSVTGGTHHHASRLLANAQLVLGPTAPSVQVQFPPVLGPVLLTVTHPQEQFLAPAQPSAIVPLRRR